MRKSNPTRAPAVTDEEMAAMRRFAARHGRTWKSELARQRMRGQLEDPTLVFLFNRIGSSGLRSLSLGRKANSSKLKRTKRACSARAKQARAGSSLAASRLSTLCPPPGTRRKSNGAKGVYRYRILSYHNDGRPAGFIRGLYTTRAAADEARRSLMYPTRVVRERVESTAKSNGTKAARVKKRYVVTMWDDDGRYWRTVDYMAQGTSVRDVLAQMSNRYPDVPGHNFRVELHPNSKKSASKSKKNPPRRASRSS